MTSTSANRVEPGRMIDAEGDEWRTKHSRWTTLSDADRYVARRRGGGIVPASSQRIEWVDADELVLWWADARRHFETPGSGQAGTADVEGVTWAAHVWRRGSDRL